MKKALSVLCLLAAFLVCLPLTSYGTPQKDKLIGKWKCSAAMSEGVNEAEMSGTLTFNRDGSYRHNFVIPVNVEKDGTKVSLTVEGYRSGKRNLIGDKLYFVGNSCDAKMTKARIYNERIGSREITGRGFTELESDIVPEFISKMSGNMVFDVTTLTSNTLVFLDDDMPLTCTRVQ